MGYIEGEARAQSVLFPEAIDDYIAEDNPVRFIDAFVDEALTPILLVQLITDQGLTHAASNCLGRSDPGD